MAVLLKNGAVFLHVPKTGGSWVTQVLYDCQLVERQISHIHADMVRVQYYADGPTAAARSMIERVKSHVPKSVKARLYPATAKRASAARRSARQPFYFCFVRHPLQWYESWWNYMCGRSGNDWAAETDLLHWHPCQALRDLGDASFSTFVRNVNRTRPGFVTELYGWYTQPGIRFVGHQERLVDDLVRVLKMMELPFDEQRIRDRAPVNVSRPNVRRAEWDDALRDHVLRLEYAGLVRYGYVA